MAAERSSQARCANVSWKLLCVLVALGALLWGPCAFAADDSLEYQVKAAFLLNFIKFIDWPESAFADQGSPVAICILGYDPFGHALDQVVEGETVNGRKVALQRIKRLPPSKSCQVLFIGKSEKDTLKTILPELEPGVLTVGEGESFMRAGGMIAFVIENRRVRFDVNQAVAETAALKLSSKLLSVARSVKK
jgi:hypothetical protein